MKTRGGCALPVDVIAANRSYCAHAAAPSSMSPALWYTPQVHRCPAGGLCAGIQRGRQVLDPHDVAKIFARQLAGAKLGVSSSDGDRCQQVSGAGCTRRAHDEHTLTRGTTRRLGS